MVESSLKGKKTLLGKEKLLVTTKFIAVHFEIIQRQDECSLYYGISA